jgi:hypothetical protein
VVSRRAARRARPPRARRRARAGVARALPRRARRRAGRPVRVLEAIPPHVGLGSGTKLALAVAGGAGALAGGRPTRRRWRAWPAAAPARRSACGRSRSAGFVVEGGRRRGSTSPRRCSRATRCRTSGAACSRSRRPSPGSRAGRGGGVRATCARPERSALIAQLVLHRAAAGARRARPRRVRRGAQPAPALVGDAFAPSRAARSIRRPRRSSTRCCGSGPRGGPELVGTGGLRDRRQRGRGPALARRLERELGAGGGSRSCASTTRRARGGRHELLVSVVDAAEARLAVAGGSTSSTSRTRPRARSARPRPA